MKLISLLALVSVAFAVPKQKCPELLSISGLTNDLGLLADSVSWNGIHSVKGLCSTYDVVYESHGVYDTRLRIYKDNEDPSIYVISFRPTQQNPAGNAIHENRRLVPTKFLGNESIGMVHERFQEAFLSLIVDLPNFTNSSKFYLASHSLGGALNIFMMIHLWQLYQIVPVMSLGLAGPFIGDKTFTDRYQVPLKELTANAWWQIEVQNKHKPSDVDGTVEGYNVDHHPFIYIQEDAICGLQITPQRDTYGLHDIKNYRSGLRGSQCVPENNKTPIGDNAWPNQPVPEDMGFIRINNASHRNLGDLAWPNQPVPEDEGFLTTDGVYKMSIFINITEHNSTFNISSRNGSHMLV